MSEQLSTHKVEVVPVVMEKHPNADSLSVVRVFGGYTCCVRTQDWQGIGLAAYLPPDSVVDTTRSEFAFLMDQAKADGKARIKAKKLRGVISFGLLVPAPQGAQLGDDLATSLGVEHYEPTPEHEKRGSLYMGGEVAPAPSVHTVKYDVDAFRRYHHLFVPDEPVVITEKLDGANSRFVFAEGKMHCGSRTEWKKEYPDYSHVTAEKLIAAGKTEEEAQQILDRLQGKKRKNLWWEMLDKYPIIEEFCRACPGVIVYGEVFGNVNCIKYGLPDGNRFAAFDLMYEGKWLDAYEARCRTADCCKSDDFPWVPHIPNTGKYNFEEACALAEGQSLVPDAKAGTIREGVVIKPVKERFDSHIGRICFKCVSGAYLEKYR